MKKSSNLNTWVQIFKDRTNSSLMGGEWDRYESPTSTRLSLTSDTFAFLKMPFKGTLFMGRNGNAVRYRIMYREVDWESCSSIGIFIRRDRMVILPVGKLPVLKRSLSKVVDIKKGNWTYLNIEILYDGSVRVRPE